MIRKEQAMRTARLRSLRRPTASSPKTSRTVTFLPATCAGVWGRKKS